MANRYYIFLTFILKKCYLLRNKIFDLGGVFIMIFRTLDL